MMRTTCASFKHKQSFREDVGQPKEPMAVASPQLLERLGIPDRPHDLQLFPCIRFRWPGAMNVYRWEFEPNGEILAVDVEGPSLPTKPR